LPGLFCSHSVRQVSVWTRLISRSTDERRARCHSHVSPRHSKLRHRKSLQSIDTDRTRFCERSHQDRDAFPLRLIRLANTELCAGESQSGLHSEAFFAELAASGEGHKCLRTFTGGSTLWLSATDACDTGPMIVGQYAFALQIDAQLSGIAALKGITGACNRSKGAYGRAQSSSAVQSATRGDRSTTIVKAIG
jgi:hypothetical protein